MSVLFLDVDGVLVTRRCLNEDYEEDDETLFFFHELCPHITSHVSPIEKSKVSMLKWIIDQIPHLKLVISSTWKVDETMMTFLIAALEASGIVSSTVLGTTPSGMSRGAEIASWLETHPEYQSNFVIVDDGHELSFAEFNLAHRFVKTEMITSNEEEEGLGAVAAAKIVELLRVDNVVQVRYDDDGCDNDGFKIVKKSGKRRQKTKESEQGRNMDESPKLVFLCGVPGLGKDSLCDFILKHCPDKFQHFRCFSQDQFVNSPNKKAACLEAVERTLASGLSVVLKRNNHAARDRDAFVQIAGRLGVPTVAIVPAELHDCMSVALLQTACWSAVNRALREGHETLFDAHIVPAVCSSFFRSFEQPTEKEMMFVRTLRYLAEPPEGTRELDARTLSEFQSFVPFVGGVLSFCTPTLHASRGRRKLEDIARDFICILENISFI